MCVEVSTNLHKIYIYISSVCAECLHDISLLLSDCMPATVIQYCMCVCTKYADLQQCSRHVWLQYVCKCTVVCDLPIIIGCMITVFIMCMHLLLHPWFSTWRLDRSDDRYNFVQHRRKNNASDSWASLWREQLSDHTIMPFSFEWRGGDITFLFCLLNH